MLPPQRDDLSQRSVRCRFDFVDAFIHLIVDIDLGDGTTKRSVTAGTNRAAMVLRALGIEKIDPPTPPREGETVM
jgi:hypothetical protein